MSALAKPSKAIKDSTSTGRQLIDAVDRARELYLAQIKRAEFELFDRIKRATQIITGDGTAPEEAKQPTEPQQQQQPTP